MNKLKSIIALSIIVFIPFGLMIWIRNHQSTGFASMELITYPLLFGGLSIVVLVVLKKYFLKEQLIDFNSGEGRWTTDIAWGLFLTVVYFMLFYLERLTLSDLLQSTPNLELLGLMLDMRENPVLMLIWFGPVLWIGIALYEELIRVFILSSLWKWSEHLIWAMARYTSFGKHYWFSPLEPGALRHGHHRNQKPGKRFLLLEKEAINAPGLCSCALRWHSGSPIATDLP